MRLISSILSFFYIAGIFLFADSPVVSKLSPYNPYSLLHIPLYGILTFLLIFSFNQKNQKDQRNQIDQPNRFLFVGLIALGVALADEIYQSFIPGRDASIIDVFLDLIGITFVLFLFHRLYKGKKARISIQSNE
jgi:VanZ family protein